MTVDGMIYNNTRHKNKIWNFLPFKGPGFPTRFLFDYYFVVHPNSFLCCVFVCLFACCRRSVSCNQWCPCLRIIHSWLTLRFLVVIIYYVTSTISVVRSSSACSREHLMVSYTGHPTWYDTKTFCFLNYSWLRWYCGTYRFRSAVICHQPISGIAVFKPGVLLWWSALESWVLVKIFA
jgi:hypothetical protein